MADDAIIRQVDAFQITESVSNGIQVVTLRPVDLSQLIGTRWWRKDPRLRVHHGRTVIFTVVGFSPQQRDGIDGLPLVKYETTTRRPGSCGSMAIGHLTDHFERAPE